MILNLKQTEALDYYEDRKTREIIFGGGAGGGKSIELAYIALKYSLKYEDTRWLLGRSKLKTLKETTLQSFFKVCQMQGVKQGIHYQYNGSSSKSNPNAIEFNNGSVILLRDLFYYPSDPNFDELGSLEITGAFIDEVNQISEKAWNIVGSRIRHNVDKYNLIPKIFGTCNPSKGFVYQNFYKPFRDGNLREDRAFIQSLVTDNPDIDKYYIENLNRLDEISKQRLLYGNWEYDDDPMILMDYDKIVDLFVNNHVLSGQKYITADIARLGNDKTKIRVWDGLRSIKKVTIDKSTLTEVAQVIRKLQREYLVPNSNTICDEDGVGGGVVDMLGCKGFVNNSRPLPVMGEQKNYNNLRSQCYFKLSDYVNENRLYLNDVNVNERNEIVQELEIIKQKNIDNDSKLSIIAKDDMKKIIGHSPDEADCLMMRMYFEIPIKKPSRGVISARMT